jgi:hypothetical protein
MRRLFVCGAAVLLKLVIPLGVPSPARRAAFSTRRRKTR